MPRIAANGIDIEYDSFGTGEPIVLVMGLGAQMILWEEGLCELLAAPGYQVIRFDNRDVGLSTKLDDLGVPDLRTAIRRYALGLPNPDAPYALDDMAADAAALIDALGFGRAHVVGASLGGMIAQTLAYRSPGKVTTLTSIMSSTGHRRHMFGDPSVLRKLMAPRPRDREAALEHGVDVFQALSGPGYPRDRDDVREMVERLAARNVHPKGFIRQLAAILAAGGRSDQLAQIRVPTLVIHGTSDPLLPLRGGKATAKAIPGAELLLFEGMGHDLPRALWPELAAAIHRHVQT